MTDSTPATGSASGPAAGPAPAPGPVYVKVSTHVLDTQRGRPAAAVPVRLDAYDGTTWQPLAFGQTDDDGRWTVPKPKRRDDEDAQAAAQEAPEYPPGSPGGTYRLRFGTGVYFSTFDTPTFYPEVNIIFTIADPSEPHHVPLLLSPYGYSTYRGS